MPGHGSGWQSAGGRVACSPLTFSKRWGVAGTNGGEAVQLAGWISDDVVHDIVRGRSCAEDDPLNVAFGFLAKVILEDRIDRVRDRLEVVDPMVARFWMNWTTVDLTNIGSNCQSWSNGRESSSRRNGVVANDDFSLSGYAVSRITTQNAWFGELCKHERPRAR